MDRSQRRSEAWFVPLPPPPPRPPGDEDFIPDGQSNGHKWRGERGFWNPPQHGPFPPPKVSLPPFWTRDTLSWFTLAESTFNRYGVSDSRLKFDLLLPALPEEALEQVRGILHSVATTEDPYQTLKAD